MNIAPPPDWYIRAATLRLLRGEDASLPFEPEEPGNVVDIRAARTQWATALMMVSVRPSPQADWATTVQTIRLRWRSARLSSSTATARRCG
jgi:hypothetical protein